LQGGACARKTELFIDIAQASYELHNLNGTVAILEALSTDWIHQLKSTIWKRISKAHRAMFHRLCELTSTPDDSPDILPGFQHMSLPKIPFLGWYLAQIKEIESSLPKFVDEAQTMINFNKYSVLATHLLDIENMQQHPYRFIPNEEILVWLLSARGWISSERLSNIMEPKRTSGYAYDIHIVRKMR
jgi:hypothetical protein